VVVPAIKRARDSGTHFTCQGRLKRVGIAIHYFAEQNGGRFPDLDSARPGDPPLSWRVALLPFLDRESLYAEYSPTLAWDAPANRPTAQVKLEEMSCPSNDFSTDELGRRYTAVAAVSGATVGNACRSIIACQLEVYERIDIYPGAVPSYFRYVVSKDKKPDEWWKSHEKLSLYEMQIEAVEWAISEQKEIAQAGKYRGEEVDTKEFAVVIARNEKMLERLRTTQKPIVAKRRFPTHLK
jgi:hypothetical protein